eukprot:sb/3462958/
MRLISNWATKQLFYLALPRTLFAPAKDFLCFGERLKYTEQRLNFLIRCKSNKLFPNFIENSIVIRSNILFPIKNPSSSNVHTSRLKRQSLNQHIDQCYATIRNCKYNLNLLSNSLSNSSVHFYQLLPIFNNNNNQTKYRTKHRLMRKFDALITTREVPDSADPEPKSPIITPDPPETKVSSIGVELVKEEVEVLALGPNFALTPKIDDNLVREVKVNIAQTACRLRQMGPADKETKDTCPTRSQHIRSKGVPFQSPFIGTPRTDDVNLEHSIKQLERVILKRLENTKTKPNLTAEEREGLRSLLARRGEIHLSRSDKGGEFVVLERETQRELTEQHLLSSSGVYEHVPPTRTYKGREQPIAKVTDTSYSRQRARITKRLEDDGNTLWSTICKRRKFSNSLYNTFRTLHSSLPTMYVLVKTHKINWDSFKTDCKNDIINNCKVRPIVSCCGGPTEKLAWIVTSILSPLLKHVPSNLQNIHEHLSMLQGIPKEELAGKQFFSADVTSLYTNINVTASVQDLVDMAEEHWEELDTWGLELVDIHEMLDFVLCNPYFSYNGKIYRQLVGLFMGSKPSPLAAIIRVYSYERRSVYLDLRISFYKRYVDDTGSFATIAQFDMSLMMIQFCCDNMDELRLRI